MLPLYTTALLVQGGQLYHTYAICIVITRIFPVTIVLKFYKYLENDECLMVLDTQGNLDYYDRLIHYSFREEPPVRWVKGASSSREMVLHFVSNTL